MEIQNKHPLYEGLIQQISEAYLRGQKKAVLTVNSYLVETYWLIGQHIVEFEQGGSAKALYGQGMLGTLSKDLKLLHSKGFSLSNLIRMRQFYVAYPIYAELPHQLSWTHWVELLNIDDPLERSFYINQTILENWSTTQLIRQKKTSLFLRLAASKDKEGILKIARQGQIIEKPTDLNQDVGQMNMYLGYFENEENTEGDNPPIGIVLAREKDELLVKYAMHNVSSQLFVSKYQLYLPNREELKALILGQLNSQEDEQ